MRISKRQRSECEEQPRQVLLQAQVRQQAQGQSQCLQLVLLREVQALTHQLQQRARLRMTHPRRSLGRCCVPCAPSVPAK